MSDINVVVGIPVSGGAPKDTVFNTLHFATSSVPLTEWPAIKTAVQTFYNSVKNVMSRHLDFTIVHARVYDLEMLQPRPPIVDENWNLGANTSTPVSLPHDVCVCVSFQATRQAGIAQARRRGRIYLGPLSTDAMTDGRVSSSAQTTIRNAAAALLAASTAAVPWKWQVLGKSGEDFVNNGWVDNEFDTQRRRGLAATSRTVFP